MDSVQSKTETQGGQRLFGLFRKRIYTIGQIVSDAGSLAPELPSLARIWMGRGMDPAFREEIMVAVARVNDCRYCSFAHHEWALHAGLPAEELAQVEGMAPEDFDPARWIAVQYARAFTLSRSGGVSTELAEKLGEHYSKEEIADIERVVRAMTIANLTGNTVDALLSRLRGEAAEGSRVLDEVFVTTIFMAVAPFVAVMLAAWRRQSPLALLRDFQNFSRSFEDENSSR